MPADPANTPTAMQPPVGDAPTADRAATVSQIRTATHETQAQSADVISTVTRLPVVSGYELLEVLGRGGMGVVYKARQVALKRIVALKMVLRGGHASQGDLARFRSETLAAAKLQHSNVVQLYDVGEHDGLPYFSLEYCTGGSLADRLKGAPLSPAEAAAVVETLARAMDYAHRHGVVHRDLKPANVLLRPAEPDDGAAGSAGHDFGGGTLAGWTLKVSDFGLAKRLDASQGQTSSGAVMGTPGYMAPEQAGGRTKDAGPEADIYALGAILYELLTGRPPFQAETVVETVMQVLRDDPAPPSRLRPGVPKALETVCLKCLEKSPVRRYPTAAALADDLRQFRAGQRVTARPPGPLVRAAKWSRRHPTATAVLGLLVVGALAGAVGLSEFVTRLRTERDRAEAGEREARRVLYTAQMNLIQSAWRDGNADVVRKLLGQFPEPNREDLRGFEWYYWRALCNSDHRTLRGHESEVRAVAFSPDGTAIATAGNDKTIRIWSPRTGREATALRGHKAGVVTLAYSPDGTAIASGGDDKTLCLWDARTGRETMALPGHQDSIWSVAFSPDGVRIATASNDSTVRVWDARTGREDMVLRGHQSGVHAVAYSPDGATIASGGGDNTVRIWDARTGRETTVLRGHEDFIWSVAYRPDGAALASAGKDGTARVWDLRTGREAVTFRGHQGPLFGLAYSPDGTAVATGGDDKIVRVWDARTGREQMAFRGHEDGISELAFSPDGALIASVGHENTVRVWDARSAVESRRLALQSANLRTARYTPDGGSLAVDTGGSMVILDVPTGRTTMTFEKSHRVYSPDGSAIAVTTGGGTVRVLDARTGRETVTIQGPEDSVGRLSFSPDGTMIAGAGGFDGAVHVWDLRTGQETMSLRGHDGRVVSVSYSPDGSMMATGSFDKTARVWDARTGVEVMVLRGHEADVRSVAYSPDGTTVASASADKVIRVWDAQSGQIRGTLAGHADIVFDVAYSPDGARLASAGRDKTVRLWDLRSYREILSLPNGESAWSVAFSPDGTRLVACGASAEVREWQAPRALEEWRAEREARVRLECLFDRPLLKEQIRAQLPTDPFLGDDARRAALNLLSRYRDEPEDWNDKAWEMVRSAKGRDVDYRRGLELAEVTCRLAPDTPDYLNTLGVAQYRAGRFADAVETLTRCRQLRSAAKEDEDASDLAFLAMASHRLGRHADAQKYLADARRLAIKTNSDQAFLQEAVELMDPPNPTAG